MIKGMPCCRDRGRIVVPSASVMPMPCLSGRRHQWIPKKMPRPDKEGGKTTGCPSRSRTRVGLTLIWFWIFQPSCPADLPILPISHQHKLNEADSGIAKMKVNPTKVAAAASFKWSEDGCHTSLSRARRVAARINARRSMLSNNLKWISCASMTFH